MLHKGVHMYRTLTVEEVRETAPPGDSLLIEFQESVLVFEIKKQWLKERGIDSLSSCQKVAIKGRKGNSDIDLFCLDCLEDMKLL